MTQPTFLPETWIDPRVRLDASPTHGQGLFASELIRAGETVIIWGGTPCTEADLREGKVPRNISYSFIDDGLLLAGPADGLDYYVNHACDPNIWMADQVTVVARRDIQPGEELRGDYAVWESEPEYVLAPCACGTSLCRGSITGNDWQRPELQTRYQGHFLPFLNRRIVRRREGYALNPTLRANKGTGCPPDEQRNKSSRSFGVLFFCSLDLLFSLPTFSNTTLTLFICVSSVV